MIFIAYLIAFYYGFALCVGVYRQWQKGALSFTNKFIFAIPLVAFTLVDVILNYTVLLVLFGLPPKGAWTISTRFESYRKTESGFKRQAADFTCGFLNEIDPTGAHC
jgi:sensor histidine kinase YesM